MNATMSQVTSEEFLIPSQNINALEEKLHSLNKRAKRLHCSPISFEKLGTERKEDDNGIVSIFYRVQVSGEKPCINGWTFVATLEHTGEGNIIHAIPNMISEGELIRYRDQESQCDHCRKNRRRIDTYLLRNDAGEIKQVGKSCLKDFTGADSRDPMMVASMAECLALAIEAAESCEDDLLGGGYGGKVSAIDLTYYLSWVHACMRKYGWVSRSAAEIDGRTATANDALQAMDYYSKYPSPQTFKFNDQDREEAKKALEWIRNGDWNANSDYLYSVSVATKGSIIDHRHLGLAASLFVAYGRAMEKERELKQVAAVSEWQGEVGKRSVFKLMCNAVHYSEGSYGTTSIYKLSDEKGNQFVWFSSQDVLEVETEYTLKATVTSHDEYKGVHQTIIKRCKVQ